uniref:Helitron helicase-like domain-containing protein n=1 Tax=Caenorhabditis japonica TaxID=281687 RepID=A0A8R1DJZ4_CAEJA
MKPDSKLKTTPDIDDVICAEILDPEEDPGLFDIVSKNMIRRPCGPLNAKSPCTNDKMECMKRFPKPFRSSTNADVNGYPEYRRREDGRFVEYGTHKLINQHIVAYNWTLLLHFNCHLSNVEAVKYFYKYIYKGHDRASIQVLHSAEDETVDEIGRYICALELSTTSTDSRVRRRATQSIAYSFTFRNVRLWFTSLEMRRPPLKTLQKKGTTLTATFAKNKNLAD